MDTRRAARTLSRSLLLGAPVEPVFRRTSGFHTKPRLVPPPSALEAR